MIYGCLHLFSCQIVDTETKHLIFLMSGETDGVLCLCIFMMCDYLSRCSGVCARQYTQLVVDID